MSESPASRRRPALPLHLDRRGVSVIETALLLPLLLSLLFLVIETGIYFTLQSSLDIGVLTTAETLRASWLGATSCSPSATTLKTSIRTNGGAPLSLTTLAVDIRQLATLSSAAVAIVDGSADTGGSGIAMVLRAQTTMSLLPVGTPVTVAATSIVRCPLY